MINRKVMLTQAIENGFTKTSEGYPAVLKYCKEKNAYDYTIYGNTIDGNHVGDMTDNLIDEDSLLPEQGWIKQDDGSFYTAVNGTVYQKKLWENTEGYTGRLKIDYRVKYLTSSSEKSSGSFIRLNYTDGTKENVLLLTNTWNAGEWNVPNYHVLSNSAKTVDYIDWSYGTGLQSTWVKDIIITKNLKTDGYEPYGYKIPIVTSGNNITTNVYISEPLKEGESINYKVDSLPDLPLFNGTNVITAETEVPPSNISVTYNTKVRGSHE